MKLYSCLGLLLFLLSCKIKKQTNDTQVIDCLKNNISNLNAYNDDLLAVLYGFSNNPKAMAKAAVIVPLALKIDSLFKKLDKAIDNNSYKEINELYNKINLKAFELPGYNSAIKKDFDRIQSTKFNKSTQTQLGALTYKNEVLLLKNNVLKHITSLFTFHGHQCYNYDLVANINKTVFKKGEEIVFQGAVLNLSDPIYVDAKVNGKKVENPNMGLFDFKIKVDKPKGKYILPVEYLFKDPATGELKHVTKKIDYEVVD